MINFRKYRLWILYLIIALVPLVFFTFTNQIFELPKVFLFRSLLNIGVMLTVFDFLRDKNIKISYTVNLKYLFFLLFGFFGVVFLATLFSSSFHVSFWGTFARHQGFYTFLHYFFFAFFVLTLGLNKKEILSLFKIILFISLTVSVFGIFQKIGLDLFLFGGQSEEFMGRIFSTLGHPNFLGSYLLLTIPISVFLFSKNRLLYGNVILIQLIALFLTLNRGAYLGFIASFLFFLLLASFVCHNKKLKHSIALFFISIVLFFISVNLFSNSSFIKNTPVVNRLTFSQENLRSVFTRQDLFIGAIQAVKEKPLLGYGPEMVSSIFPKFKTHKLLINERIDANPDRIHNEILDILFSYGLFGLLFYLSFLILFFYASLKYILISMDAESRMIVATLLSSIFALFIANQFGFSSTIHFVYFWLYVALIFIVLSDNKGVQINIKHRFLLYVLLAFPFLSFYINIINIYSSSQFKIANAFVFNSDFHGANDYFQSAVDSGVYNEYDYYYANNLSNSNKIDRGLDVISVAIKKNPADFNGYLIKARLLKRLMDFKVADEYFKLANQMSPLDISVLRDWGDMHLQSGDFETAIKRYDQILELAPDYWSWEDLDNKTDYERQQHRIFFKLNPNFRTLFVMMARAYYSLGQELNAFDWLKYADHNSIDTLTTYGVIHGNRNEHSKALEYYERANELYPDNVQILKNIDILKNKF